MSVGVETGSGTDNRMYGVTQGVVNGQIDNQIMETTVGSAQVLCVNALNIVRRIVAATHWTVAQMSVCIKTCTCTDNLVDGVAQGVVHRQIDNQIMVTAVWCTKMLCVNTLHIVWRIVHSAYRTVAEMSVGVEACSSTDDGMYGVTNCIVHRQINDQIMETTIGGAQVLRVNALHIVWRIVHSAHRTVAEMSVGVETRASTNNWMDGVTESIIHSQIDNQIMETTVGGAKVLCVNALHIVWRIVHSAHRCVAQMSVGVETRSSTDNGMYCVADSVIYRQIDNQIVEATIGSAQVLCVNALHIVRRIITATHRTIAQVSIGVKTRSGTDNGMYCVAQGVVDMQVYYQIIIMHCQAIKQILSIDTCIIVFYAISIQICSGTYCSSQRIAYGNKYHQIAGTISCRISQMLDINTCILVSYIVGIKVFA